MNRSIDRQLMQSVIESAYSRMRLDWPNASQAMHHALRKLPSAQRSQARDVLFAVTRARPLLTELCALRKLPATDWTIAQAAQAVVSPSPAWQAPEEVHAWRQAWQQAVADLTPREQLCKQHGFPEWMADTIMDRFPDEATQFAVAFDRRSPIYLRVNPLKSTPAKVVESLATDGLHAETTGLPLALRLAADSAVATSAAYREGLCYIQDIGSQVIGELLQAQPGETVLDACAGAGGKTLLLAQTMKDQGQVIAVDTRGASLKGLRSRMRSAGVGIVTTHTGDAPPRRYDGKCDRAIVDAPCSGLGTLRRKPALRHTVALPRVARLQKTQIELCKRTLYSLKPGGRLVYATCTFLPQENEEVAAAVAKLPGVTPVCAAEGLPAHLKPFVDGDYVRCLPHRHDGDGFFAAVFRKN